MKQIAHSICSLTVCLLITAEAFAASVEAIALFNDQAMLRSDKEEVLLKVGETSAGGMTLLSADPKAARVRYQGEVHDVVLSKRVSTRFRAPAQREVRLNIDASGHYRARGAINDHYLNFLVDTGASVIVLSEVAALQLNLDYRRGQLGAVQTAQGITDAYFMTLDKVTVGSITVSAVEAAIVVGAFPAEALLGMSFLRKVDLKNTDGLMVLTARP